VARQQNKTKKKEERGKVLPSYWATIIRKIYAKEIERKVCPLAVLSGKFSLFFLGLHCRGGH